MKAGILLAIVGTFAALALIGCAATASTPSGQATQSKVKTVEVSDDDFNKQKDIVKDITIAAGETFQVILSSNASTGFSWSENATIGDAAVLQQVTHDYNEPNASGVVGAAGTEVWTFKSLHTGSTTVTNEYSRPWEGGEKGVWTFALNVTVK